MHRLYKHVSGATFKVFHAFSNVTEEILEFFSHHPNSLKIMAIKQSIPKVFPSISRRQLKYTREL